MPSTARSSIWWLPSSAWCAHPFPARRCGRASRGVRTIVAFFCQEIPRRRAGQATDLFSELCRATKEDGSLLTDQEIADHMSFLMMAAHDTLTSSVTSLVYLLGKHPEWQDKLRAEMHRARSSARCTSSLRTAGRARTLRDGLQGSHAHQSAGARNTTRRRARLPIQRSRHPGWHTCCVSTPSSRTACRKSGRSRSSLIRCALRTRLSARVTSMPGCPLAAARTCVWACISPICRQRAFSITC